MIAFRDQTARRLNLDLIVHTNKAGLDQGINPFTSGSSLYTQVMKTDALKQAMDKYGFDAAFGGARGAMKKKAEQKSESFRFDRKITSGIHATNGQSCGICTTHEFERAKQSVCFHCRIGLN